MTSEQDRRSEIERLLGEIRDGSDSAKQALYQLVVDELRGLAAALLHRERQGHTLQPTALVHEAYLKVFVGAPLRGWDKAYFFATQARAMRQVLIDHARRRKADKRPDGRDRVQLDAVLAAFESAQRVTMLDLGDALRELESANARQHDVVSLRFFGGLGWTEIAESLDISVSSAEKDWQAARAWLHARLRGAP